MLRRAVPPVLGLAAVVAVAGRAWPATAPPRPECPGYAAHLRQAAANLRAGRREVALSELLRARESLQSCLRGSGSDTGLAAAEAAHTGLT